MNFPCHTQIDSAMCVDSYQALSRIAPRPLSAGNGHQDLQNVCTASQLLITEHDVSS